jgi:hypothetical protein
MADWPDEECDDGNTTPNDGCTNCSLDFGTGGTGGVGGAAGFGGTSGGGFGGTG